MELFRIFVCTLVVFSARSFALGDNSPDSLISPKSRAALEEQVGKWSGARWFHEDEFYRALFRVLQGLGVYPPGVGYSQAGGGKPLFSLSRLSSGPAPLRALASLGSANGVPLAPDLKNSPVLTIRADGHTVTYLFQPDRVAKGKFKVDRVIESNGQLGSAGQALLIYDRQDPAVEREANEYRIRRKLELCDWQSENVRAIFRGHFESWIKEAKDPSKPLGDGAYEGLFKSLQKEGLLSGQVFKRELFSVASLSDARKHGEAMLQVSVPRRFQSERIQVPKDLDNDLLSYRYPLFGGGKMRVLSPSPLNCTADERRRLEKRLQAFLPAEVIRAVSHHY